MSRYKIMCEDNKLEGRWCRGFPGFPRCIGPNGMYLIHHLSVFVSVPPKFDKAEPLEFAVGEVQ
jgi:hypothetical protein